MIWRTLSMAVGIGSPPNQPSVKKRRLPVVALAALVLIAVACGQTPAAVEPPAENVESPPKGPTRGLQILFELETLDMGNLPTNQVFEARFDYHNVGDAPLVVEENIRVEIGAGC